MVSFENPTANIALMHGATMSPAMDSTNTFEGGYRTYGGFMGVLMLDTSTPRPPGDCGNARTYDFPVQFRTVEGASANKVVTARSPEGVVEPFVEAGQELVQQGAAGIITGCGYLLRFQEELSAGIAEVPVFSSPMLQIPLIDEILTEDEKLGVIVSEETEFLELDYPLIADNLDRFEVEGLNKTDYFVDVFLDQTENTLDQDRMTDLMVSVTQDMADRANLGAFLFECTNLHPYSAAVQEATDLPVFDHVTLAEMAWRTCTHTRY